MKPKDGEHPPELTKSQCRHVVVGVDAREPWGRDQTTNSGASPRRGFRHASILSPGAFPSPSAFISLLR